MSIEERTLGTVTVLDVAGRMTIETVGDMPLLARVRRLLQGGGTHVVLNLAGVPYVDTTGIADLVEAYVATRRQGGSLKLLHLTPHVRAVLTMTRLLTILEAYETEADAVASGVGARIVRPERSGDWESLDLLCAATTLKG